ncbi:IS3 family transposase [Paenibacillus larvae]|nr:IS3 family transposase [Paenibacillus larvae]MDT2258005.1 IS3 family transposase [Paenibacillus larvae]
MYLGINAAKELNIPEASIRRRVKYYENGRYGWARRETWEIKRFEQRQAEKEPSGLEEELIRLRAENEYFKSFGRYKGGEENVSKNRSICRGSISFKGYSISMLCEIAHVSRSISVRRRGTSSCKQLEDQFFKGKDSRRHQRLRGILGYPRMRIWLKKTYGIHVNHKRVYRLMKQMGIQAQIRKKKRYYDKRSTCGFR